MKISKLSVDQNIDEIIKTRRSIRQFTPEMPSEEDIKAIVRAGALAPYSSLADTGRGGRKFVVVSVNNPLMNRLSGVVKDRAGVFAEQFKVRMRSNSTLQAQGQRFLKRLEEIAQKGPLGIGTAPYYIVVAEKKGIPDAQHQSISHCLENMWLKATALGLGFHLVSITGRMEEDDEFCSLINIPTGEYRLDGCAVGYPAQIPLQPASFDVDESTAWFV